MKLVATALALAALPALACSDDDGDDGTVITWRVPCGAIGEWQNTDGVDELRYRYDADKQLVESTTRDATGTVSNHSTRGWVDQRLAWVEVDVSAAPYRLEYRYDDGGRMIELRRIDRDLDNGDASYRETYTYDDRGALTASDFVWDDTAAGARHATITGNLTPTETWVDCEVADPTLCATYVYQQPDRDPDHWLSGTGDLESDGVIDYRWTRTIDRHGLDLTWQETAFNQVAGGALTVRYRAEREADGSLVESTTEYFDPTGGPDDTYRLSAMYTCAAARVATGAPRPDRARLDEGTGPRTPRRFDLR